ncbi:MAG: hypothetical protein ABW170_11670 [Candidatus Thiodiazotropha sp. L084R]
MQYEPELEQLAIEFFKVFSRSEYALKAAGFHRGDGNAEANWTEFAKSVENFAQSPDDEYLESAIEFIQQSPPRKQVVVDGLIDWSAALPNKPLKADNLLIYIRRVRNNLFHGGKFNEHWFDPERSERLIRNSLVILRAFILHVDSTREAYLG